MKSAAWLARWYEDRQNVMTLGKCIELAQADALEAAAKALRETVPKPTWRAAIRIVEALIPKPEGK
jgi:hypothetical protein